MNEEGEHTEHIPKPVFAGFNGSSVLIRDCFKGKDTVWNKESEFLFIEDEKKDYQMRSTLIQSAYGTGLKFVMFSLNEKHTKKESRND